MLQRTFVFGIIFLLGLAGVARRADDDDTDDDSKGGPAVFKKLKYRMVGPAIGGRVSRAAGVPGDPLTYYAATASGGVWKSSDAGVTWKPIFDEQPISSIGSIAVAASDPNVIYVGAGEANIRGNVAAGNGIYKSTDAGKTWKHVWKQEGQIGTMIVHPTNANIAFAAVLGHAFGPNPERGVYRTTDGGKTWQQVLAKNADTGASDVCFDPSNPHVLYAGFWQTRRYPWALTSGGPGSGLYVSRDGGDTWKQLKGKGLPEGDWGKVGVAVAPSDGRRVYALIEAEKGGLFRSDDGGDKWTLVNGKRYLRQRAWYFFTLTIDPSNADVIWCPQVPMLKSIDGGKTFQRVKGLHHGDHHDLWIDPKNPKRMIDSNDGGVDISTNGGESWFAPPLPLCQFYHVAADNRVPYHVSGTLQDIGTASGPSNNLSTGGIAVNDWYSVGGGETGFTVPDPTDPNVVYAGEYGGYISRFDFRNRQATNVSIYPYNPSGHGAADLRYRFQWTAPILVSPHDPKVIYHAANVLFRSNDRGRSWTPISGDLTRNDRNKQQWSGGPITGDNTGAEFYCTIFAIAESPKEQGLLWAGSDDGLVHVRRNGTSIPSPPAGEGKGEGSRRPNDWTNVTANIPSLPEWGTVSCIEPSRFDAATVYLVVDAHRLDNMKPYLYKSTDNGKTWKSLAAKLPQDVYLHAVREDPQRKGLLYAGTERGVSYSTDDGETWQELKLNLPTVAVHDLLVKDNDLVVGTNGRSVWILDDLTPIRELTAQVAGGDVHLFPAAPAIRWRFHRNYTVYSDKHKGDNPPRGAILHYYLKNKPKKRPELEILDAQGNLVRKLGKTDDDEPPADDPDADEDKDKKKKLGDQPGVHRIVWDLAYEGATAIKKAKVDMGKPKDGPLVLPGVYTVRLTVDGQSFSTRLVVQADPRVPLSESDLKEQLAFALKLRDDITKLSEIVHQIRSIRTQFEAHRELLKDRTDCTPLCDAGKKLLERLDELESKLHNPKAEVTYDILAQKGGAKLYSQLGALFDWAKDTDDGPTQGMREVYQERDQEFQKLAAQWNMLRTGDVVKYNELAKKLDTPTVVVPEAKAK